MVIHPVIAFPGAAFEASTGKDAIELGRADISWPLAEARDIPPQSPGIFRAHRSLVEAERMSRRASQTVSTSASVMSG
jgi:hypothetical protein